MRIFDDEDKRRRQGRCVDGGTKNCPCPLADTGDCMVCGKLQAYKDRCDCDWMGMCVYNEYIQNGGKVMCRRENMEVEIVSRRWYADDLLVMVIKVSRGFALQASFPGSFLFLSCSGYSGFGNVPISVMHCDVDRGEIHLAIKVISAKTKVISEAEDSIFIRGVYRNGLIGLDGGGRMGHLMDERWLILTKGVGIAPAINLVEYMGEGASFSMIIDEDKICHELTEDYLLKSIVNRRYDSKIQYRSLNFIEISHWEYDRILICASDYYIQHIVENCGIPREKLVWSNNFHMCCGEGICGSCSHVDKDGNVSKMCKCRLTDLWHD